MPFRPRGVLAALAVPALVAAALTASPPAQAAAEHYVALGDSYSSGTGTRDYIDDGADCDRSSKAYSSLIAARNAAVDARLARVRAEIDLARLQGRAPFGTSQ